MCGIIGYTGSQQAAPIIFNGLKHLEYRGYDSAGILTLNPQFLMQKDVGTIDEINFKIEELPGTIGIGHTRWATHGKVTKDNAHPHLSNNGTIAVVHNGIIENYQALRDFLRGQGLTCYTETDTEVIPNLIELFMREHEFLEAVKRSVKMLEGSYAIAILCRGRKELVVVRKESPLIIGVGNGGFFVASDIPAFLNHTKNVLYLYEHDIAILNEDLQIFNLHENRLVQRPLHTVEWNIEQVKKGNFNHFMMKEITEQTDTIKSAIMQDRVSIMAIAKALKNADNVFLVGCGSSHHACLSARYTFSAISKQRVNVFLASEFANFQDMITPRSVIVAVSQSGETADVLAAVKSARVKGARIISIVNVMGSSLTRVSDELVMMQSGPEICVLSTKTYTAQLAILTLIAYALIDQYREGERRLKNLINYIYYLTSTHARNFIKHVAYTLKDATDLYLIGRGLQYPTALEAALKIKEVSYLHAEGLAGGELKHGTIALIEQGTPCIVFTSKATQNAILGNVAELKARGATIIGIGPQNNELFDTFIKVREAEEANSICQIIPIQILAYQLALLRGLDPDKPRNLAKSVTVP